MSKTALVSIPVSREMLDAALVDGLPGPLLGFAVTPALLDTFGLPGDAEEDAEFAALLIASIVSLTKWGERLVVTAEVSLGAGEVAADLQANGGVCVAHVPLTSMVSWFSDVDPAVASEAAGEVADQDLESAWANPAVSALLADHDLAWHSPSERFVGQD